MHRVWIERRSSPSLAPVLLYNHPVRINPPGLASSRGECQFASQAQAQRVLEAYPGDRFKVDRH
ncbi:MULTISPECIES: hypothetical protein [unclassified Microcoleus]|uniref:hypothetical protein n=1 Tax=unclassified Microcoleus TaxID=2642155 RepID=UPI002FD5B769